LQWEIQRVGKGMTGLVQPRQQAKSRHVRPIVSRLRSTRMEIVEVSCPNFMSRC
jgi:hypothetical protein